MRQVKKKLRLALRKGATRWFGLDRDLEPDGHLGLESLILEATKPRSM